MAKKANKTFRILGRVFYQSTRQGVSGLRVEAWDNDLIFDDLVGSATTDAEGRFQVDFTDSYFKELFLDQLPDLFFKVFHGDELIKSTENSVMWNVTAGDTEVVIEVDIPPPGDVPKHGDNIDKVDLLLLEDHAHLTFTQLSSEQPELAHKIKGRMNTRLTSAIAARFAGGSDALRVAANRIRVSMPETLGEPVAALAVRALRDVVAADCTLAANSDLDAEIALLDTATGPTIADAAGLDLPLRAHPELSLDLAHARVYRVADASGLPDRVANVLATTAGVHAINDASLGAIVDRGELSAEEARRAGHAVAVYGLLDERPEMVAAVAGKLEDAADLTALDDAAWQRAIKSSGTRPPGGMSVAKYASALRAKTDALFPTRAIARDLNANDVKPALDAAGALDELRAVNPGVPVLGRNLSSLATEGIDQTRLKRLSVIHAEATAASRQYIGLGLDAVLDAAARPVDERATEVGRRIDMAHQFFADNPNALALDLRPRASDRDRLKFSADATPADRERVLAMARSYQRALNVGGEVAAGEALIAAGLPSATAIAKQSPEAIMAATGLDAATVDAIHLRANDVATVAAARVATLIDIVSGGFNDLRVGNLSTTVADFLKEIPGYADFFGRQDFCDCSHCQSILGPAAYFVDLMRFVEANLGGHFTGRPSHPLRLRSRRPDLWDRLELTCENTNTEIPYLEIIDEILEDAVARDSGYAGNLDDRALVRQHVYDQLRVRVDSFQQPFHLPFVELATYLSHFDRSLADLAEAGHATGPALARLRLTLSPSEYALITTPIPGVPELSGIYGIAFAGAPAIQPFDAQLLLPRMAISRDELGEMIATQFVTGNGAEPIRIVSEKLAPESVQNDVERIYNLTPGALDRMHRFVRLWRATGWRIGELDLTWSHLENAGVGAGLNAAMVSGIGLVHRLRDVLHLSVEELIALFSTIPDRAVLSTPPRNQKHKTDATAYPQAASPLTRLTVPLLDRLFNQPRQVEAGGRYPQTSTRFLHPSLAIVPPVNVDPNLHRLKAGLNADEDQLYQLILGLARPLGVRPASAVQADREFTLSQRNLSLLYRHARLARLLKVSMPELFALAALTPEIALGYVETLAELEALLRTQRWVGSTRWSIAALVEICRPGAPAIAVSAAAVANTAAGLSVTCTVDELGVAAAPETVVFAANANLAAVVTDWNAKAQRTVAYRATAQGVPSATGDRLAIRTRTPSTLSRITITADAAGLIAAALPRVETGLDVALATPTPSVPAALDVARQLVADVAQAGTLVFADSVFTQLAPIAPRATSRTVVANTAAGDIVRYGTVRNGIAGPVEAITFAAHAALDDIVADWNAQATATRAFRSDDAGRPSAAGDRLSIRLLDAVGDDSRFDITRDTAAIFTQTARASYVGLAITDERSRELVAANAARLEIVDGDGRLRLRANYDPGQPLGLAGLDPALEPALRELLNTYHGAAVIIGALPGKLGVPPSSLPWFVELLGDDLAAPAIFAELRDPAVDPVRIAAVIERLRRLSRLFADARVFDDAALGFVRTERARLGIASFDRIGLIAVRRLELWRTLSEPWIDRGEERPDLPGLVVRFAPGVGFAAADLAGLAELLRCDVALVQSLQQNLPASQTPFEAIEHLIVATLISRHLGVGGAVLGLIQSTEYASLTNASTAIQAAFRAKYTDEAEWEENREPYRDALLSRQRDGLVAYLLRSRRTYPFDDVNDLYHHFLLDVQLEGVVRTSRVAAAIASVQLYVQRCIMNLEETPPSHVDLVRIPPNAIPYAEWEWRQNYRVWEANRKVFLFPENYIEPELRDDKTPLFRALEDELLSKPITEEGVREAYARYLRGFDELSALSIAGSYHERDRDARHDVLHLFGTTSDDPPVYHYRRVDDAHYGVASVDRATRWGPWERIDLQIPSRTVSPVVHKGQLYLFWVRYVTRSVSQVKGGDSQFAGYSHRAHVEFSKRRLDGTWTSPQPVALTAAPFKESGDGIILDPLVPNDKLIVDLPFYGRLAMYFNFHPLYDPVAHHQAKDDYTLRGFGWDRVYPATGERLSLRGINFQMWSNVDLYRRQIGPQINYDTVVPPGGLKNRGVPWIPPEVPATVTGLVGFFAWLAGLATGDASENAKKAVQDIHDSRLKNLLWSKGDPGSRIIHALTLGPQQYVALDGYSFASLLLERERIEHYKRKLAPGGDQIEFTSPQWHPDVTTYLESLLTTQNPIVTVPLDAALDAVNGAYSDAIVQVDRHVFHIGFNTVDGKPYVLRRLNSSVSEKLAETLFEQGLDALLATSNQLSTNEPAHGLNLMPSRIADLTASGTLDYDGPMGTYLREIFFHIPFMLADHLNSLGEFEAARRWYHFIFDPTSSEVITGLPAGLSDAERRRRELDRVWRYRELRGVTFETLRAQLQKPNAIEAYKRHPFNPHAIARMRLTAYQKAIVMKYIDNLLDWGDHLFALAYSQSNPEYLREATLKYVIAQDLLGRRPARLGECGEAQLAHRRLPDILNALVTNGEFLMEVESLILVTNAPVPAIDSYVPSWTMSIAETTERAYRGQGSAMLIAEAALGRKLRAEDANDPPPALKKAFAELNAADQFAMDQAATAISAPSVIFVEAPLEFVTGFTVSVVELISTVFCVSSNPTLRAYWDRVEDRLFKIHNSLDIDGVFRRLPLFAPPIDPALMVRVRAAGLGFEDVLGQTAGSLPPYRFVYLIEKAKAYAGTLQGFGGALLSSLEKRDAEELATLRNVHEKNLLKMTREIRRAELTAADVGVEQVTRQQTAAQYRFDHAAELIATGLSNSEGVQVSFRMTASVLRGADALLRLASGIAHLVPEVGSPFSMKYGGKQAGESCEEMAQALTSAASVAEIVADMSGLIAGFERREESWQHDRKIAEHDLKVLDRELAAAKIRRDIAQRSLDLHEKSQEQHDEVMELYRDKFSGFGLYTYLSRTLQQLHREGYGNALAVAQLAEQAYHYELPGDDATYLGGEWDGGRSGLLAGERLTLELSRMERRFLERHNRRNEINQSFSIDQIAPAALIELRETGSCDLAIPEFYFDLHYPGQYRRQIRGVRVSIPCVTGPYTNVSAKLTLRSSRIRSEPRLGALYLVDVPLSRTVSIATSNAQNDAGVFELSFRDERYNPFEGAGAVSDWRIELPSLLRPFDYRTISDVVVTISYTAEDDGILRHAVEDPAGADGLVDFLTTSPRTRVFSLHQEFSGAFQRLLASAPGTDVTFDVDERHLPLFLGDRQTAVVRADVVLVVDDDPVGAIALSINGTLAAAFANPVVPRVAGAAFGGLPSKQINAAFAGGITGRHSIAITNVGALGTVGAPSRIDPDKLRDVVIVVAYSA